jgi:ATP-binding cassette, subfamily B, bacterial
MEEKSKHKRKIHFSTLKRVVAVFMQYKVKMSLIIISIFITTGLNLLILLLLPLIFDEGLTNHNMGHLAIYGTIIVIAALLAGGLGFGQTYLNDLMGQYVMRDLRNKLYAHLQNLSLSFFASMRSGEIQSRLSNDISSAQSTVTETFTDLVTQSVVLFGTVAALFYLSPLLTLISFTYLPFFLFIAFKIGKNRRKSTNTTQQRLASLNVLMQETLSISGILLIKIFGRKNFAQSQFEAENEKLTDLSIRQEVSGNLFFTFISTFMTMVPVITTIAAGVLAIYLAGSANITLGSLFAFITIQSRFFGSFNQLLRLLVSVQGSLALFDRIFEYLDQEVEIKDAPDAVHLPLPEARGEVSFKDVSFAYKSEDESDTSTSPTQNKESRLLGKSAGALEEPASRLILNKVSFTARLGQFVAIVGPSGAGKTTITNLIPRLYDVDGGAVEIDGYNVSKIALASLHALIGIVTQETHLFHASIRQNLLYVCPEATEEEMIAATKAAAIHDRILQLGEGYETVVGERGYKLSGGEKQRLAIARVLLKNPPILILDEATSSLDTNSERLIQDALKPLMKGRTTIAIAHRLSTIRAADLILVLDKGVIVERGNHEELLERNGVYAKLYYQQFARQIQRQGATGLIHLNWETGSTKSTTKKSQFMKPCTGGSRLRIPDDRDAVIQSPATEHAPSRWLARRIFSTKDSLSS